MQPAAARVEFDQRSGSGATRQRQVDRLLIMFDSFLVGIDLGRRFGRQGEVAQRLQVVTSLLEVVGEDRGNDSPGSGKALSRIPATDRCSSARSPRSKRMIGRFLKQTCAERGTRPVSGSGQRSESARVPPALRTGSRYSQLSDLPKDFFQDAGPKLTANDGCHLQRAFGIFRQTIDAGHQHALQRIRDVQGLQDRRPLSNCPSSDAICP